MIRLKKKLAAILATIMLTTCIPQVAMAKSSDYEGHWASQAIAKWEVKGLIKGYEDGTFRPSNKITRAELASILSRVFGLTETKTAEVYSDVASDTWYAKEVAKISASKLMNATDGQFRPDDIATREEAAYAIATAYHISEQGDNTFTDVSSIASWAKTKVNALASKGYINGYPDGSFKPQGSLTRAELVGMLDNITEEVITKKGTYTKNIDGNLVINTRDVVLKDLTIKGNLYLAEGIGDGDITLDGITVEGTTIIEGGGINSIVSRNSTYYEAIKVSAENPVRVVVQGDGVKIEALPGSTVTLTGSFKEVIVNPDVNMQIKDAKVDGIIIIALPTPEAKNQPVPTINIDKTATVGEIKADAPVQTTGEGKIDKLIVNSDGVKTEQKPDKVTIEKADATANIAGKEESNTTTKPSGGSGGSGGSDSGSIQNKYAVSGKVFHTEDGVQNPVQYAHVQIIETTKDGRFVQWVNATETDANGNYSFYVPYGKYYIVEANITATDGAGYLGQTDIIQITKNTVANVELIQKPVANITVTDKNGVAIPYVAIVKVSIEDGKEVKHVLTHTDLYGFANVFLLDEEKNYTFHLYMDHPPLEINNDTVNNLSTPDGIITGVKIETDLITTVNHTINVEIPDQLKGTVAKATNSPNSTTIVTLFKIVPTNAYQSDWKYVATATVDASGNYSFNITDKEAIYSVYAYQIDGKNRYLSQDMNALLASRETLKLKQSYTLEAKVVDKDDNPINGAKLKLTTNKGNSTATTWDNGTVVFDGLWLQPGQWALEVEIDGQSPQVIGINAVNGQYNYSHTAKFNNVESSIKLATIHVTGNSLTLGDKDFTPHKVLLHSDGWGNSSLLENGTATISIPKDAVLTNTYLTIAAEDDTVLYEKPVSLTAENLSETVDLANLSKNTFTGTVLLNGSVTTGAAITLYAKTLEEDRVPITTIPVDTNGTPEIGNLVPGYYIIEGKITTGSQAYIGTHSIHITPDKLSYNIHLKPALTTTILVQDTNGNPIPDVRLLARYSNNNDGGTNTPYTTDGNGKVSYIGGINQPNITLNVSLRSGSNNKYNMDQSEFDITSDNQTVTITLTTK